jgi:HK97 family phage major capsid protein
MSTHTTFAPGPVLGLTAKERQRATLAGLIDATIRGDKSELAFFAELSEQTKRQTGQEQVGGATYLIPGDMLGLQKRDMLAAGVSGSQYLVANELDSFADALAKASIIGRLPVVRHTGLQGNQTITLKSTAHTHTWLASEGVSQIADAQATYGQLSLTPHSVAAVVTLSRQFLQQMGPQGRAFVDAALARALAEAVDNAMLNGSGASGQPLGIYATSGIDSRAGTSFALSDAAAMLKLCDGFAGNGVAWVAGVDTAEDLRQRLKSTNGGETLMSDDERMLGKPVLVSRSANAQQLVVTDWTKAHFAEWGALELGVDPFTNFSTGKVIVRALWRMDVGFEAPGQIAVCTAVT